MRIIVATCSAEYTGRLTAHLPKAKRVLLIKGDSSVLIFSELGSYKPLNWMAPPCVLNERWFDVSRKNGDKQGGAVAILKAHATKSSDRLVVRLYEIDSDESYDLGIDPGLMKDGVEDQLQHYLSEQIERIGPGARLVRREYPTPIGPVDILAVDGNGVTTAIEIKRHGDIDGVEQLTRYVTLLDRDERLSPVRGIFAAQTITPQARTLAIDRGFKCLILDYEDMKNQGDTDLTLF
ncbi:MAG: endonuclease NucS [Bifidobacteriaceae bacterium]|nr:endonuclease NucS [Aeriscardovia sp.]MEE1324278.1 endonuclease NucS [Bifidobacteriaceae bacterium]